MSQPIIRPLRHRPALLGALLFAGALALAGLLAYQAAVASAGHRAAVQAALAHHSAIAAWRYAREIRGWLGIGIEKAWHTVERNAAAEQLPPPSFLLRVLDKRDCDCIAGQYSSTRFRITPASGEITVDGNPLGPSVADTLISTAALLAVEGHTSSGKPVWRLITPGPANPGLGHDFAILWWVDAGTHGEAVYGMVVEPGQVHRLLRGALEYTQFFPPSLVPTNVADTLIRIEVARPGEAPIFSSGPPISTHTAGDTLGHQYGGLTVTTAIAPGAAEWLVVSDAPAGSSRGVIAMAVLALALGVGALLMFRREHQLARLREDFVSSVSHELRTPLTQIRMLSELLEADQLKEGADRSRATSVIHREALRLTNMVDNLLEFARLRRPRAPAPVSIIPLAETFEDVGDSLGPLLASRRNRLEISVSSDLAITADRDFIARVIRNLVENAIKYGPPDQTIRITADMASEGRVLIAVEDQGPGIPQEERSTIWQPYYRLSRDRNAPMGGSGLGLSVVADTVQQLGGTVAVEDADGGGARFLVLIPVTGGGSR